MAPFILEGDTLGKKHQSYNNYLKLVINGKETLQLTEINSEDSDVDNLMKIDIAANNRDVEYILKVLKCEDMLYVSKAIKKCTWLITDPQYERIINPKYLELHILPEMTSKAIIKLMLQIRLNLKSEERVEQFYIWIEDKSIKNAVKWLPNCSVPFIEKMVKKHADVIELALFKRLCERSFTVLEVYLSACHICQNQNRQLELVNFFIHTHLEKYMDIVDKVVVPVKRFYCKTICLKFGKRATEFIMRTSPQRIIDNFQKYSDCIDLKTFAKQMASKNIKEFLLKEAEIAKDINWLHFNKIKLLIQMIPIEERFEFVKEVFIDKLHIKNDKPLLDPYNISLNKLYTAVINNDSQCKDAYFWYQFAPFDIAFKELIKLISCEKSPEIKYIMLNLLVTVGSKKLNDTKTLLKYYCDKHINDNLKFKVQFVNTLLSYYNTHKYDDECWNYLKNIYQTIGVYEQPKENLQNCVVSIIIYEVIRSQNIPDTIEPHFNFEYVKSYCCKSNQGYKNLIFNYFYEIITKKIKNQIASETDFEEAIESIKEVFKLLIICKKDLVDYPFLLKKIKELIKFKNMNGLVIDLSVLYNFNKSWRKLMFNESIALCPSEDVCLNILKHSPMLFIQCEREVEAIRFDNKLSLPRFLQKLRVYWTPTLARDWITAYHKRFDQLNVHKSLTRGLFALLAKQKAIEIIQNYAPTEAKINWDNIDQMSLSFLRHIAKTMHIARPQPSPELILLYAKGDYLQYALPSLNAIFYNLCLNHCLEYIPKLLDSPVSLQKHGLRLAFNKMKTDELERIFCKFWKSAKNLSIRANTFKLTHKYLCEETNESRVNDMWKLLEFLMDNLTTEEDKSIYMTLLKVEKVPISVRAKFLKKSFNFIRKLIQSGDKKYVDYDKSIKDLAKYTEDIMESVDPDFIVDILIEFIDTIFTTENNEYWVPQVISKYIFFAKHEQTQKIVKLVSPLMERLIVSWNTKPFLKDNFDNLICNLHCRIYEETNYSKIPINVFSHILNELEKLPVQENYVLIRKWKLIVTLANMYNNLFNSEVNDNQNLKRVEVELNLAPEFGRKCLEFLKEDVKSYFPCIYILFSKALNPVCVSLHEEAQAIVCSSLIKDNLFIEGYLCAIKILPVYCNCESKKNSKDVHDMIKTHPSAEVRMHYYDCYNKKFFGAVVEPCEHLPE